MLPHGMESRLLTAKLGKRNLKSRLRSNGAGQSEPFFLSELCEIDEPKLLRRVYRRRFLSSQCVEATGPMCAGLQPVVM